MSSSPPETTCSSWSRFKEVINNFQDNLRRDVKKVNSSDKVLVFADKSRNVSCIRSQTNVNQWRNTHSVIDWFCAIKGKSQCTFLIFDIADFYPSISEALLTLSLDYAKQFTTVSDEDEEIILHSRKTLLFNDNEPWVKAGDCPMFDVAMGSYDGAEVCELVGLYIPHKLTTAFPDGNIGL